MEFLVTIKQTKLKISRDIFPFIPGTIILNLRLHWSFYCKLEGIGIHFRVLSVVYFSQPYLSLNYTRLLIVSPTRLLIRLSVIHLFTEDYSHFSLRPGASTFLKEERKNLDIYLTIHSQTLITQQKYLTRKMKKYHRKLRRTRKFEIKMDQTLIILLMK